MALHNYLRQTRTASYCPNGFVDSEDREGNITLGEWRSSIKNENNGCFYQINNLQGRRNTCAVQREVYHGSYSTYIEQAQRKANKGNIYNII